MLALRPLHRAALTSCTLMAAGDAACQVLQQRQHKRPVRVDLARVGRFAVIGLTLHGPFFFKGFQALDGRFGTAPTLKNAVLKSVVGQLTLFPVYTSLVVVYSSLLEGRTPREAIARARAKLPELLVGGTAYWPAVNVLNFMLVPPHRRVLAVNACAVVWNAYLSYVNAAPLLDEALSGS